MFSFVVYVPTVMRSAFADILVPLEKKFHIFDFILNGFYQIASIYIMYVNINERLYEYLKGTFNVIKVQFSHFGSIWTNISETVHVMSDQLNVCMKYMCGSVDYRCIFNV